VSDVSDLSARLASRAGRVRLMGDIYLARDNPKHGWSQPRHLAYAPDGPNSELDEQGPSLVEIDGTEQLFFSRSSGSVPGDIFVSHD
jgi:hypothetical protein